MITEAPSCNGNQVSLNKRCLCSMSVMFYVTTRQLILAAVIATWNSLPPDIPPAFTPTITIRNFCPRDARAIFAVETRKVPVR